MIPCDDGIVPGQGYGDELRGLYQRPLRQRLFVVRLFSARI